MHTNVWSLFFIHILSFKIKYNLKGKTKELEFFLKFLFLVEMK